MLKFILSINILMISAVASAQTLQVGNLINEVSLGYQTQKINLDENQQIIFNSVFAYSHLQSLGTGDLNNDGRLDVIKSRLNGQNLSQMDLYLWSGLTNNWQAKAFDSDPALNVFGEKLIVDDFDQDGCQDLVTSTKHQLSFSKGLCDGKFEKSVVSANIAPLTNILLVCDYNKDEKKDIVSITNYRNHDVAKSLIGIHQAMGQGEFNTKGSFTINSNILMGLVDQNKIVMVGSRARHSGRSGIFIIDMDKNFQEIASQELRSISALAQGPQSGTYLLISSNTLYQYDSRSLTVLKTLPSLRLGENYADLMLSQDSTGKKILMILKNKNQSNILTYKIN